MFTVSQLLTFNTNIVSLAHMNQTINISLPKGLAELAEAQVKSGYFSSVSEVIRHAIRHTFMEPVIPTLPMTPKIEKQLLQALKDHKEGKTTPFKSFKDLDMLNE
jgi:hypothetical protein